MHEGGQDRAAEIRQALLLGQAADAAFFFRDVGDQMLGGEVAFEELDQIVGETEEMRLHLLGAGGIGPGALGTEFIFEFVEDFFEIPPAQVEEDDHAGGQCKFAGEALKILPDGRMRVADPPQGNPFGGRDQFVGGDADVVGVGRSMDFSRVTIRFIISLVREMK